MTAITAESQSQKVALVGRIGKTAVGIVAQMIASEIQNSDRLLCLRLLRSVAIVQQCRVLPVRAHRDFCGETVDCPDASRGGRIEHLARGQRYLMGLRRILSRQRREKDKKNDKALQSSS